MERAVLGGVCVVVIGLYAFAARSVGLESISSNAADTYYSLLVQGFRAGQLSLKRDVPPGLAQLADPYDPAANALYRSPTDGTYDLSYYKGRLYLYFGVTPALILFWPFVALTGHYLSNVQAVVVFLAAGFLAGVHLLYELRRRYFAEVGLGAVLGCTLALGFAMGAPVILSRCEVHEVAISCGYMVTMLSLTAIWHALHESEIRKASGWVAAASMAYGLAVGARPSLLFGAVILLVPVAKAWRERKPLEGLLLAATVPIALIGLGLMLYNALRFDNPFEFGAHYQLLRGYDPRTTQLFNPRYLWFNLRLYYLEPVRWGHRFPFVREIVARPMPTGHGPVEQHFGVLINVPLVWLALAAPLAWRARSPEARSILRWFVTATALLLGIHTLTISTFFAVCVRYEVEFLPAFLLLAVVGTFGLERVLAPTSESGLAERQVYRRAWRVGWGLLLVFSAAFNLLAGVECYAETHRSVGNALLQAGEFQKAINHYEQALRFKPDYAEAWNGLGAGLAQVGRLEEAIGHWEQAVRINPDLADAHYNLAVALEQLGRVQKAIPHYQQVLRIKPDDDGVRMKLAQLQGPQ